MSAVANQLRDGQIAMRMPENKDELGHLGKAINQFLQQLQRVLTQTSHAAIEKDGVQLGVIAQEIQKVLPECVSENSTGVLSVNTDPLVWYLINAVKELKAEIQALKGN